MAQKNKISGKQLLAVLLCSRVAVTLTYSANNHRHIVGNSDWLAAIFFIPILLIMLIPVFISYRKCRNYSVIDRAFLISPKLGKATAISYALFFAYVPVITVARFNVFVTSTMQTETSSYFYPLIIMSAVLFAAVKGLEPIGRTGVLSAVLGGGLILIIILALIQRFDFRNMISPFYNGFSDVASSVGVLVSNSAEIAAIAVAIPFVNGKINKTGIGYSVISGVIISVIMAAIILTLGAYASFQEYPFYTASGVAQIGSFKRMNAVHSSVWLVGSFIKSSFFVFLSYTAVKDVFKVKNKVVIIGVICLIVGLAATVFSVNTDTVRYLFEPLIPGISVVLFGTIIPLALYIPTKRCVV